jgi:hypothetical protein
MAAKSGAGARRSQRDKERAAELKRHKVERRTGRCVICGATIGNDTLGGSAVLHHYAQHARGYDRD